MATRLQQTTFVILSLAVYTTVGLNCTVEDCEEKPICPPDSELIGGWKCICTPGRCSPPPTCHYNSKAVLKHKAAKTPGDCCDIYDCVFQTELNCTGVICSDKEDECPPDSYSLPRTQVEGECCSKPMGCACLPRPCPQPSCPNGRWLKAIRPGDGNPGSCCPLYQCSSHVSTNMTCSYDGKEVPSGTKWKKSECIECLCNDGLVHCATSIPCPELPPDCPGTRIPPGKCCPVCVFNHNDIEQTVIKPGGCKSTSGIIHENGATWQEDDCTNCTCVDGAKKCQAEMCQFCVNATHVSGECCPRCNGPSVSLPPDNCTIPVNCALKCSNGYAKDDSDCAICKCREEECHLNCESGFLKDGSGTEICECAKDCPSLINCPKKCKHGYKINKAGCEICKCDHCKPLSHCTKKCPHGFQTNQKGCPTCTCKAPELFNETNNDSSSLECVTYEGIKRDNGEAWFDDCRQCYCFNGKEMCSLMSCPKVDCPEPTYSKDLCCPICPGNDTSTESRWICYGPGGSTRREGETWKQGCLDCICHNGSVLCHSGPCPPVLCQHPLQGDCCPVCPEEAEFPAKNITYQRSCGDRQPGEKWRQSDCTSCICTKGEAVCYTQTCNEIDTSCKTLVQLKSQCCPICLDNIADEKICQVGNVSFNIGDEWEPEKCTRCKCGPAHTISCTRTIYEKSCSKMDNPCCPECIGSKNYYWSCCFFTSLLGMFGVVIVLLAVVGAVLLYKYRCVQLSKSHQLTICQPTGPTYHYKSVLTYDQSRSPLKSPV